MIRRPNCGCNMVEFPTNLMGGGTRRFAPAMFHLSLI